MTAENKEPIDKDRVIAQISAQMKKQLKSWLEKTLKQEQFEELQEKDLTLVPCTGGGIKSRKRDSPYRDRRYMIWGGLKIGEKILRLNLFHVGEEGISESAQLVILDLRKKNSTLGTAGIQGLTRGKQAKAPNVFSFAGGSLSGPINNAKDLCREIHDFFKEDKKKGKEKGRFSTEGIAVDLSVDCRFREATDTTSNNIHPQPEVINRVFKKLVKNRLVVTDKTGIGEIAEQIVTLDLDVDVKQKVLSDLLKYYKKEAGPETFDGIIRKHFDINQENKLAQTPCKI